MLCLLGRRAWYGSAAITALAMAAVACGSDDGAVDDSPSGTVEIFSWWTADGEKQALADVLAIHKQKYPNVTVDNLTERFRDAARDTLATKFLNGNPPDTFQANIGEDLMNWVKVNGADAADANVGPIDGYVSRAMFGPLIAPDASARSIDPYPLIEQITFDGALYAVPMGIHRINSLFFNIKLFEDLGIPVPTEGMTLAGFNDLCAKIREVRPDIAPLAVGDLHHWTVQELTFEIVLPAIAGADYYEEFWRGHRNATDPQIKETLDEVLLLSQYFNDGWYDIDWPAALALVKNKQAAMAAIGDWAKGYFEVNAMVADTDFGVIQFPGEPRIFVYTSDSFPLPIKDTPTHTLGAQLLQTFASTESQIAFSHRKGSIPARSDIILSDHPESFDPMHLRTYQAYKDARRTLAVTGLLPGGLMTNLGKTVKASYQAGTTEVLQTYLNETYSSLQQ